MTDAAATPSPSQDWAGQLRPAARRLVGKSIAVTGAASGLGLAITQRGLAEGARIALLDRDDAALAHVSAHLSIGAGTDEGPPQTLCIRTDVTDPGSVTAAFSEVEHAWGRLDGLVNNAGLAVYNPSGRIEDVSDADWSLVIAVNLTGTFLCCRSAAGLLERSGSASIVNIASTAALIAEPGLDGYCAAKGGVVALTRALALSNAGRGIRVNVACPGLIRTPMAAQVGPLALHMESATPLPIPGPEAVTGLVVYLLSDESSYMTGSTVVLDGGMTAQ